MDVQQPEEVGVMVLSTSPVMGDEELLEELDPEESLRLLAAQPVGRLAIGRGGDGPLVVPVNFAFDGGEILFRTGPGAKLSLSRGATVSFQVDGFDPFRRLGWSVLVVGRAFDATCWDIDRHDLRSWAGGSRENWIRIVIAEVSGRRIHPAEPAELDGRGYL